MVVLLLETRCVRSPTSRLAFCLVSTVSASSWIRPDQASCWHLAPLTWWSRSIQRFCPWVSTLPRQTVSSDLIKQMQSVDTGETGAAVTFGIPEKVGDDRTPAWMSSKNNPASTSIVMIFWVVWLLGIAVQDQPSRTWLCLCEPRKNKVISPLLNGGIFSFSFLDKLPVNDDDTTGPTFSRVW